MCLIQKTIHSTCRHLLSTSTFACHAGVSHSSRLCPTPSTTFTHSSPPHCSSCLTKMRLDAEAIELEQDVVQLQELYELTVRKFGDEVRALQRDLGGEGKLEGEDERDRVARVAREERRMRVMARMHLEVVVELDRWVKDVEERLMRTREERESLDAEFS